MVQRRRRWRAWRSAARMSGQVLTLNCGVPGPDSQMPCLRQTWWWAGRWTGTGWLMRRDAVQRRHAVTTRTGRPRLPPKAGSAVLMAAAVEPPITASLAAAAGAQGMRWLGCQRSSCQRPLTRSQGGRISSRALDVVRLAAARRPRNDARASPATGAAGTGSGAGWVPWAAASGEYPLMLAGWQS